MEATMIQYLG